MPQLDKPLEELKEYKGISPCPIDIDEYWERALSLLDTFDWDVKFTRVEKGVPYASCYDLTFTGVKGARIYAKYIKPSVEGKKNPGIIKFHGYHGNSGDWQDGFSLVAAGFSYAALDCRGQSGKSQDKTELYGHTFNGQIVRGLEDGKDNLAFRDIYLDCVQLTRIVMDLPEVDEDNIAVTGASQGGGLTLACASLEPRIKYVAPIYPFLSDYKRVWDMDLDIDAYAEIRHYFRQYDPLHIKEDEIFNTLGYIDIKNLTNRIKGEVLMTITLMDNICPPSTQFAAYNNIESRKESIIYYDYGHEHLPGLSDILFDFFMKMKSNR
ncbi:acetylxylan esterase [Thiospirochaeta perfilievii]|uniref:Acetylxylan esterase n=1 Tax=Thiospirochaeta perfilievii TaxID=252967 RepID=A0A5C1Q875_9SPIO|nr:acetylxylan esterase [Thiospirochaeta perfilievii]QEN03681.1 acetylxylan esterase [Thiospirochaeta perfilievii]